MKTMTTHRNYVVEFDDGSCKVGVTARPRQRMAELRRSKGAAVMKAMFTPASDRASAFKTEREICRLLAYRAEPGTREWYAPEADGSFCYLTGTTGMFWRLNAPTGSNYLPETFQA